MFELGHKSKFQEIIKAYPKSMIWSPVFAFTLDVYS